MENNPNNNANNFGNPGFFPELKNAKTSMILGIAGLFLTFTGGCIPAGFVMGIIAYIQGRRAERLYEENPSMYFSGDLQHAKTGKVTGIISIVLSSLGLLVFIGYIILMAVIAMSER